MARIYNQEQYQGNFNPVQQSRGFNPVIAVDATSKERQKAEQELADIATETKSLTRQQDLDTEHLRPSTPSSVRIWKLRTRLSTVS